ncbi:DUF1385 domain-containing protein [Nanoarchaeota archaeon]
MAKKEILTAGGQAVIEGVLMRTKDKYAIAVRDPKGKIVVKKEKVKPQKNKILKLPFIRGIITLGESMSLGIKALNWSAEKSMGEEQEQLSPWVFILTIIFAIGVAIAIFKFLPFVLTSLFNLQINTEGSSFAIIEGIIKLLIFIIYLMLIGMMGDIKTVFQYHGAEHMTVHCYEAGKKLTVANVKKFGEAHARCGTAFLMFVIIISIIVYTFVRVDWGFWAGFGLRLALLPIIIGVSYEILRLSSRFKKNVFVKILILPGLLVQKLTTKRPTDKQLEVAIRSLKEAIN